MNLLNARLPRGNHLQVSRMTISSNRRRVALKAPERRPRRRRLPKMSPQPPSNPSHSSSARLRRCSQPRSTGRPSHVSTAGVARPSQRRPTRSKGTEQVHLLLKAPKRLKSRRSRSSSKACRNSPKTNPAKPHRVRMPSKPPSCNSKHETRRMYWTRSTSARLCRMKAKVTARSEVQLLAQDSRRTAKSCTTAI